jgi:pimeloyl-ACP methyl ester carboxylesterase
VRGARWFRVAYPDGGPLAADDPHRLWERTVLDFDPRPRMAKLAAPTLWIYGDPALDRNAPVALSLTRLRALRAAGRPYEIIQIDGVGHTLELANASGAETLLKVRLPLVLRIYRWLDREAAGR